MGHYVSFVVQSWRDSAVGTMRWQVSCVDQQEPLVLPSGSFVVRTWIDDDEVVRGIIRHVQSGNQVLFQSSRQVLEFIQAWIGCDTDTIQVDPAEPGEDGADG